MLVQQPSLDSLPQHSHSKRSRHRKQISPALSSLLSATTIPCPRNNKHRKRLNSDSSTLSKSNDIYSSASSSVNSSSLLSPYSSRRSSASSSLLTTPSSSISNDASFYIKPFSTNTNNSSSCSTLKDLDINDQFLTLDDFLSAVISDCEEDDDDDDEDDDNDSYYSFNIGSMPTHDQSLGHNPSLNQRHGLHPPARSPSKHTLTRRASAALLRSNNNIVVHPLAVFDDGYEADDALTSCNEAPPVVRKKRNAKKTASDQKSNKYQSFVSNLTASFKAVATSFSTSNQQLVASKDIFRFSPRSTDEPIPGRQGPVFIEGTGPARAAGKHVVSEPLLKNNKDNTSDDNLYVSSSSPSASGTQTESTAEPASEATNNEQPSVEAQTKTIPLKTYSIEEYALAPVPKGRDYRENSEFLRVYSMENMMRKNGKFDPLFTSKAQVVLLPRKDEIPAKSSTDSLCSLTTLSGKGCGFQTASNPALSTDWPSRCGCNTGNGPFSNTYKYLYSTNHGRVIRPCIHSTRDVKDLKPAALFTHVEGLDTLLNNLVKKLQVIKTNGATNAGGDMNHQSQTSSPTNGSIPSTSLLITLNQKPVTTKVPQRWVSIDADSI